MGWSDKYKKSIDCNNPKGFSQKAHCAGRKIRKENMKLSELKNIIKDLIQERSINAISKAQEKNREDIARALELYKKAKGGNKSYNEKNLIKVLKKLGQDKKKLEKEMDDKISSLYKNADYKGPIDEGSVNEILVIVDKFDKRKQDYGKVYYQDGGKRPGDGDINKAKKELAKLSKKHKGLTLISVGRNSKMYDVMDESVNEGVSREEFRIAAMAIRKQAKFRNVSPEQAIQDQLNALKLLQRYIKKGDVKKYTGMNLSEDILEASSIWKIFDQKQKLYDEAMNIEIDMKSISKVIGQIYKDMEQEAEPSGGKVADKYGKQLNNLEKAYKKRKMELKKVFAKIDKLERY